ncbi:dTMP kinase [Sulfurospirillum sp. 1612]|uniref:dTMP kinase n=1 Tax=Sulfurospirillum sp. 1612 TaxID=3094835 RepID=UPI002F93BA51
MYVIFEGIDTTGKSTQIELFKQHHDSIITLKEPGNTKLGETLRDLILNSEHSLAFNTELFLFLADRAQNFAENIAGKDHDIILSDRGMISGIAYALANNQDLKMDFLIALNQFALGGNLPDAVVFFHTNRDLIVARLEEKEHDNIEQRGIDYLLKVQDLMEAVLSKLPVRVLKVDAQQTREKIYQEIEEFIYDTSA